MRHVVTPQRLATNTNAQDCDSFIGQNTFLCFAVSTGQGFLVCEFVMFYNSQKKLSSNNGKLSVKIYPASKTFRPHKTDIKIRYIF